MIWIMIVFCLGWVNLSQAAEVKTHKTSRGWELLVDGKPFLVQGMCYSPTAITESSHDNTRRDWMIVDDDQNGINDYAYQTWVDKNRNNVRDVGEESVGDFELMHQMGVNTIRVYHHSSDDPVLVKINRGSSLLLNHAPNKALLREMYERYGIRVAMGDLIGSYTVATNSLWANGTDYTDPLQCQNMLRSVEQMVLEFKDEPYLLMWILGNENNYQNLSHTNAAQQPEAYAKFVNQAALLIKRLDRDHPVATANGSFGLLEYYAKYAKAVDIFGLNLYSGNGFYELWRKVHKEFDRPVLLTEFGTAHPLVVDGELVEQNQARIHQKSWEDIVSHRAGGASPGNAIGGFVFEWVDEWWHDGDKWHHNINPSGDGWNQEYNGMMSLGDGTGGSLIRQPREVYWIYKKMWNGY